MAHAFLESRALISVKAGFRSDIQSLRAVAVLAVIAFHISPKLFPSGYLGVDLFFVISGFVITPLIVKIFHFAPGELFQFSTVANRLVQFYKRRFLRLTPAFGVMFLISIPILTFLGDFSLIKRLADQCIASLLLLGNYGAYKFAGDYFNPGIPNPFIHTWSLSIEEQFYLLFPFLLFVLMLIPGFTISSKSKTKLVLLVVGIISFYLFLNPNLLIPIYAKFFAVPQTFVFYSPITRLWQFALGGLLSLQSKKYELTGKSALILKPLVIVSLIASLFFPKNLNLTLATIAVSFFSVSAILTRSFDQFPQKIIDILQWIGDRSYSIYLIHLPLIYLLIESPYPSNFPHVAMILTYPVLILAIIKGGDLMFRNIEERYRISPGAESKTGKAPQVRHVFLKFQFAPFALSIAVLLTVAQGFFGLVARSSIPQEGDTFQKHCVRESFVRQFPCRFDGPKTGRKILLLGDSHAAQYSMDIWKIASSRGYEVYFGGDFGGAIDTSKVISLTQNLKPQKVIVSKYWRAEGRGLNSTVANTILELNRNVASINIVGQNPIFKIVGSHGTRLTLISAFSSKTVDLGQHTESKHSLDSKAVEGQEAVAAFARANQFHFVDPTEIFCTKEICNRWENGKWLYIDNNHLSTIGAAKVRSLLTQLIDS